MTCSIGADEKLAVTGLVANIGTRLAALDLHARVSMDGRGVDLVLNAAPTDGPMLVLKAGEGKAFTFINDPNYDPHPLWEKSYENKACWLNWKVLGPDKISDYWGRIDDHRAPKKNEMQVPIRGYYSSAGSRPDLEVTAPSSLRHFSVALSELRSWSAYFPAAVEVVDLVPRAA